MERHRGWRDAVPQEPDLQLRRRHDPLRAHAAERQAARDPRPSLEERYSSHAGYVAAVRKATARAVAEGFLLPDDAAELISLAEASHVLR